MYCGGEKVAKTLTSVVCGDLTAFGLYSRPRSRFSHRDLLFCEGEILPEIFASNSRKGRILRALLNLSKNKFVFSGKNLKGVLIV